MNPVAKLGAFALAVAVALGLGAAVGAAIGPIDTDPAPAHDAPQHEPGTTVPTHRHTHGWG